jgi:N-acetylmuramoyl-L-alanine amidase
MRNLHTKELVLFIDAGHGGVNAAGEYMTSPINGKKKNFGTYGYHGDGWFYEGYSNRIFADLFMQKAVEMGYLCIPVYHPVNDTNLSIRTSLANNAAAQLGAKSIFISFHSNAFNGTVRGFNVFHHASSTKGKLIAESVGRNCGQYCTAWGSNSPNPVRTETFHVLSQTNMPAILLETLFFDNSDDADLLMSSYFREGFCNELLKSINSIKDSI